MAAHIPRPPLWSAVINQLVSVHGAQWNLAMFRDPAQTFAMLTAWLYAC